MKENKCIVAISHSNYLYRNAGTEKCMREVADILRKNEIHYFQIFSFEENSRLQHISNMNGKVGINYDKKFIGIYSYKDIPGVMKKIQKKYNVVFIGVHIHNVLNHNYISLSKYLKIISLPILIWVHDYTSICPESPILLKNKMECCCNFKKDPNVCSDCCYNSKATVSQKMIKTFYNNIDNKVWGIIAPSNNVKKNILIAYPNWMNRIHVRGHLKFKNESRKNNLVFPLKIAYVGGQYEHKGFNEWEKLVESFSNSSLYEFYYMGASKKKSSSVTSIFVDASFQGNKAMSYAAKNNKIDVAFLWSKCQETYSYTYYEMRSAGVQIVTYNNSGNISERVCIENTGLSFSNINELICLMNTPDEFLNKLNMCSHKFYSDYEINDDINLLVPPQKSYNSFKCDFIPDKIRKFKILSFFHFSCNLLKKFKEQRYFYGN